MELIELIDPAFCDDCRRLLEYLNEAGDHPEAVICALDLAEDHLRHCHPDRWLGAFTLSGSARLSLQFEGYEASQHLITASQGLMNRPAKCQVKQGGSQGVANAHGRLPQREYLNDDDPAPARLRRLPLR